MLEKVTIEQLRMLRAVADEGSFSAAARKLGRVQAAASQSIDRLEAQLGLRLFDRTSRVPRLTPQGEAVLEAAARIHQEVELLDELVEALKLGVETKLSIAADAMFPTSALVTFAQEFSRAHPSIELVIFTEMLSAVSALVRGRQATLGIAGEDADLEGLERRRITTIRMVPVAAPSHALARIEGSVDAHELSRCVQIVLGERTWAPAERTADSGLADHGSADRGSTDQSSGAASSGTHGVLAPRTWRVADLATKLALLRGGLGWGHMPEHLVRDDLRLGHLVELSLMAWGNDLPARSLVLVRRMRAPIGPVAKWAEERLTSLCREAVDATPPR